MRSKKLIVIFIAASLTACEVGPEYKKPALDVPQSYKENTDWKVAQPADNAGKGAWWSIYNDPLLDSLLKQVEISNQNVAAAEARYRQALALTRAARSDIFPTINLSASESRSKSASGRINTTTGTTSQNIGTNHSLSLSTAWELDVWGKLRRALEAQNASMQASAADLANTTLSAQAELAQDYFQLRATDAEKQMLDDTVAEYQKYLTMTNNRYAAGVASKADVTQAQTQLLSTQSQAVALEVTRAQMEHAIALLIGKPASEFSIAPAPLALDTQPPVVPAGMPSALLERRPDVASAERSVVAANAQIGVAKAAYFPALTLNANDGFQSSTFSGWVSAPNNFWSLGPQLAVTLLDFGARRAQVAQAKAAYDETIATYRQTALTAFQEVEDNLATLRILEQQAQLQDDTVKAARESFNLEINQYKAGIVSYTDVVTTAATLLNAQRSAVTILNSRMAASVALVKALGGSWEETAVVEH